MLCLGWGEERITILIYSRTSCCVKMILQQTSWRVIMSRPLSGSASPESRCVYVWDDGCVHLSLLCHQTFRVRHPSWEQVFVSSCRSSAWYYHGILRVTCVNPAFDWIWIWDKDKRFEWLLRFSLGPSLSVDDGNCRWIAASSFQQQDATTTPFNQQPKQALMSAAGRSELSEWLQALSDSDTDKEIHTLDKKFFYHSFRPNLKSNMHAYEKPHWPWLESNSFISQFLVNGMSYGSYLNGLLRSQVCLLTISTLKKKVGYHYDKQEKQLPVASQHTASASGPQKTCCSQGHQNNLILILLMPATKKDAGSVCRASIY